MVGCQILIGVYDSQQGLRNNSEKRLDPFCLVNRFFDNRDKSNLQQKTFVDLKARFPYYQGESTIFDKGNLLYQTPETKNL